jgi:hypothetical protein
MNTLISFYAWSPIIFTAVSLGWVAFYYTYAKSNPKILLIVGLFLIVYFVANLYSSSLLIKAANCERIDAGSAEGCTLLGQDVTSGLYTFMVLPWFGILVIGAGILFIGAGLVLMFGWSVLLKVFGYSILALFILAFLRGLLFGTTK